MLSNVILTNADKFFPMFINANKCCIQVCGHGSSQVMLSDVYLSVAVKVASSIFLNKLNATNLKSSIT